MTRGGRITLASLWAAGGLALLAWYLSRVGLDRVAAGLDAVRAGIVLILLLALGRFALRSLTWRTLLRERVPLGYVLSANIAGDALGNLTPMGLVASEPAKVVFVSDAVPPARGMAALMAENFFYSISIAIYLMFAAAALVWSFDAGGPVRIAAVWSLAATGAALVVAAWLAWQRPALLSGALRRLPIARLSELVDRLRAFEIDAYGAVGGQTGRLVRLSIYEAAFHALSFLEAWYTVWLLTGASHPLEAFVLDGFSRFSNVAFRMIPLRLGVDQAGSGLVAQAIGLDPAIGASLSLVRTIRVLVFGAVGLLLLALRRQDVRPAA